jgi:hypothetical protein
LECELLLLNINLTFVRTYLSLAQLPKNAVDRRQDVPHPGDHFFPKPVLPGRVQRAFTDFFLRMLGTQLQRFHHVPFDRFMADRFLLVFRLHNEKGRGEVLRVGREGRSGVRGVDYCVSVQGKLLSD